ncbi:uncharacterized protein B0T23DRAFT_318246 [Neurospora hispaniola]|uniref:Uncharacterized protein n=1 Tax=Neurospora hispaniola TaxID=588809 RepID=A0AAJ0I590_9PEZI|nr:hypothetical protein B0T23DRAFT_318246 [Neurospora hispaniola]
MASWLPNREKMWAIFETEMVHRLQQPGIWNVTVFYGHSHCCDCCHKVRLRYRGAAERWNQE